MFDQYANKTPQITPKIVAKKSFENINKTKYLTINSTVKPNIPNKI